MHLKLHKTNKNLKINNLIRLIVTYPIQKLWSANIYTYKYIDVLLF